MKSFDVKNLKELYLSPKDSHKGQNGKLMIIGGSKLFHGASLWALKIASRVVDMVFYSSVPENNEIAKKLKSELYDLILVPRDKIGSYIEESECVLIGPGMPREEGREKNEEPTKEIVKRLLNKYPEKKWVIDGGALTEMKTDWIPQKAILTPHVKEFGKLFKYQISNIKYQNDISKIKNLREDLKKKAKKHNCAILLKGQIDIVCSPEKCQIVEGGNAGMTKGGTGDVLAGLAAAFYCKNNAFLAASAASYINKKAGEELFKKAGYYFNASDLCNQIPLTMKIILR